MVIHSITHKKEVHPNKLKSHSFRLNTIGFWAEVKEVNSIENACTVINAQGLRFENIPLASNEWVVQKENFVASERNLPPVGSRVFILVPAGDISGAFILCSGYPANEPSLHKLWAADANEKEKKNNSYERVTQSGWNILENYTNGNLVIESHDRDVKIEIDLAGKKLEFTAWQNKISADNLGINIEDKSGNNIIASDSGVTINGNLEVLR